MAKANKEQSPAKKATAQPAAPKARGKGKTTAAAAGGAAKAAAPAESKPKSPAAKKDAQPAAKPAKAPATAASAKPSHGAKAHSTRSTSSPKSGPPSAPSVPLIDTSLAAQAAANMIMSRAVLESPAGGAAAASQPAGGATGQSPAAAQPQAAKQESSTFKKLKQSLTKPPSQGLGGLFGTAPGQKKGPQNFGGGNQVGRNQTFGPDTNRAGVPRRTGG